MTEQETPTAIAAHLARYLPRSARDVLDPCTGNGALIAPILRRLPSATITALDIRPGALKEAKSRLKSTFTKRNVFVLADFLKWGYRHRKKREFDCIVMNPPFHARRGDYVELPYCGRKVPIEIAFFLTAIDLLRNRGRLLAVLPFSPIASASSSWFRTLLFHSGQVKFVHELPPFTFRNVESRIYLTVFEKGCLDNRLLLLNHDLKRPHRLALDSTTLSDAKRLDFGWHEGRRQLLKYRTFEHFNWLPVGSVAQVIRGDYASPKGKKRALHTTHFEGLFWRRYVPNTFRKRNHPASLKKGDLLLKRVSRDALLSCGPHLDCVGHRCSDCVLILRPINPRRTLRLLFAFRIFFQMKAVRQTIECGTGSTYISAKELAGLEIPSDLADHFPREFQKYSLAIRGNSISAALSIEKLVYLKFTSIFRSRPRRVA